MRLRPWDRAAALRARPAHDTVPVLCAAAETPAHRVAAPPAWRPPARDAAARGSAPRHHPQPSCSPQYRIIVTLSAAPSRPQPATCAIAGVPTVGAYALRPREAGAGLPLGARLHALDPYARPLDGQRQAAVRGVDDQAVATRRGREGERLQRLAMQGCERCVHLAGRLRQSGATWGTVEQPQQRLLCI